MNAEKEEKEIIGGIEEHQGSNEESKNETIKDFIEENNANDIVSDNDNDSRDGYLTDEYFEYDDKKQLRKQEEPSQEAVNGLPFSKFFCFRLEKLWNKKREIQARKRWKEKERLEYVLPRQMLNDLNGQSIFPYIRLLLPEQDSRRQFRVKEKKIAETYCKAQGFGKGTKNYEMIMVSQSFNIQKFMSSYVLSTTFLLRLPFYL